jgi:hypothetical protein
MTCGPVSDHDYDCSADSTFLFCRKCGDVRHVATLRAEPPNRPTATLGFIDDDDLLRHVVEMIDRDEYRFHLSLEERVHWRDFIAIDHERQPGPCKLTAMTLDGRPGLYLQLLSAETDSD